MTALLPVGARKSARSSLPAPLALAAALAIILSATILVLATLAEGVFGGR